MSLTNTLAQNLAYCIPRIRTLVSFCREYVNRFDGLPGEGDGNFITNGERLLLRRLAPDLRVVFDVGAHTGEWTTMLLAMNSKIDKIYSFEPCAATFSRLSENPFPPTVSLQHLALSSTNGTHPLYVMNESGLGNTFHNRVGLEDACGIAPTNQTETVTTRTLDSFLTQEKLDQVDLVKIDTEGHEIDVLAGARESLTAGRIARIQFEYGGSYIDSRHLLKDAFDILLPLNYRLFVISGRGLVPCPRYNQFLENFRYKNLLALHERVANPAVSILTPFGSPR